MKEQTEIELAIANIDPRIGLTEKEFRKYEEWIAKACYGTVIIEKNELKVKASTFVNRFNDARRGYLRFKYKSTIIPDFYDVKKIKAATLHGVQVILINKEADEARKEVEAKSAPTIPTSGAWEIQPDDREGRAYAKRLTKEQASKYQFIKFFNTDSRELDDLKELASRIQASESLPFNWNADRKWFTIYTQ